MRRFGRDKDRQSDSETAVEPPIFAAPYQSPDPVLPSDMGLTARTLFTSRRESLSAPWPSADLVGHAADTDESESRDDAEGSPVNQSNISVEDSAGLPVDDVETAVDASTAHPEADDEQKVGDALNHDESVAPLVAVPSFDGATGSAAGQRDASDLADQHIPGPPAPRAAKSAGRRGFGFGRKASKSHEPALSVVEPIDDDGEASTANDDTTPHSDGHAPSDLDDLMDRLRHEAVAPPPSDHLLDFLDEPDQPRHNEDGPEASAPVEPQTPSNEASDDQDAANEAAPSEPDAARSEHVALTDTGAPDQPSPVDDAANDDADPEEDAATAEESAPEDDQIHEGDETSDDGQVSQRIAAASDESDEPSVGGVNHETNETGTPVDQADARNSPSADLDPTHDETIGDTGTKPSDDLAIFWSTHPLAAPPPVPEPQPEVEQAAEVSEIPDERPPVDGRPIAASEPPAARPTIGAASDYVDLMVDIGDIEIAQDETRHLMTAAELDVEEYAKYSYSRESVVKSEFDPTQHPDRAPNFLYGMVAPAWAEENQIIKINYDLAVEIAGYIVEDAKKFVTTTEQLQELMSRSSPNPHRIRLLKKIINDAINGDPDKSHGPSAIDTLLVNKFGKSVQLRPDSEIIQAIYQHAFGWGPLEAMMADSTVTEIMVTAWDTIFTERTEGRAEIVREAATFESPRVYDQFIDNMARDGDVKVNNENPTADLSLPDGSRVNIVIDPVVKSRALTIRRFKQNRNSLDMLYELGSFDRDMYEFFLDINKAGANIITFGPTGSGKTTLLGALLNDKNPKARLVIVEDTDELFVAKESHPNTIKMLVAERRTMRQLVKNALRMRADHLIVGETRDATAYDLIQAFNTGTTGSMSTIHATSPMSALVRLASMVREIESPPSEASARMMVADAINIIVHAARLSDGNRRIMSITEVLPAVTEKSGEADFHIQPVFSLHHERDENDVLQTKFVHNPDYVMGVDLARLFRRVGLDADRWTGANARARGLLAGDGEVT
jgi:pilus assembly protein CpaF